MAGAIALKGTTASDFAELTWGWPWGVEGWAAGCHLVGSPQSAFPWILADSLDSGGCLLGPLFYSPSPHPLVPSTLPSALSTQLLVWIFRGSPARHGLCCCSGWRSRSPALCLLPGPDPWPAPRSPNSSPRPASSRFRSRAGGRQARPHPNLTGGGKEHP